MNWLGFLVQEEIEPTDTVLDLGCGIMQASDDMKLKSIVGVDAYMPYLDKIKEVACVFRMSLAELDRFPDNSYDVVICLDVVEHLDKEFAFHVMREMKRICRKKAVVYTPRVWDDNKKQVENTWGLGHNPLQEHKCLFGKNDFKELDYFVLSPLEGFLALHNKLEPGDN